MTPRPVILIVEDDADSRQLLSDFLNRSGYSTIAAANGREAIERLDDAPSLCLILLDLMMPVMSGWQFRTFQRTHRRFSNVPVVVLTAVPQASTEGEWLGTAGVLSKPVDLPELLATVRRFCPG